MDWKLKDIENNDDYGEGDVYLFVFVRNNEAIKNNLKFIKKITIQGDDVLSRWLNMQTRLSFGFYETNNSYKLKNNVELTSYSNDNIETETLTH